MTLAAVAALGGLVAAAASTLGGAIPGPLPIFPRDNWWNLDVSTAPVDPASASYIAFIGSTRTMHPDFGGDVSPGSAQVYGFPYAVVDSTVTPRAVQFQYSDESDGVNHATNQSVPFYPIPDEAITQAHWIEGGDPGNVDLRSSSDRHLLIVDRDRRHLYELYNVFYDGSQWHAGSGAFFDLNANGRRPDGWTSADAAGLAILPGLVRYDEVFGPDEIGHAFRVTVRATNGYVYPASHRAGSTAGALPMGARLRLKASRNISGFSPDVQKIFRAMKRYGLIVADNGSDLYVSGTYDTRWDNGVLNPAFRALTANDFEVVSARISTGRAGPAHGPPRRWSMTFLVLLLIVGGVALRAMSAEERARLGRTALAAIREARDVVVERRRQPEPFRDALRARTPWAIVTPALVVLNLTIFVCMFFDSWRRRRFREPRRLGRQHRAPNDKWRVVAARHVAVRSHRVPAADGQHARSAASWSPSGASRGARGVDGCVPVGGSVRESREAFSLSG